MIKKIAVDIGHNALPYDMGAVGVGNENVMNMETGKKVVSKLQALGYITLLVAPSTCTSVRNSLAQRVNKANNWGADLYVAIHYNAGGGHGVEIWASSSTSTAIAGKVLNEIVALGFTNRGVKIQGQGGYEHLYVLNNTSMPGLLCEGCFVDSASDIARYNSEAMASAIVKGITGQSVTSTASFIKNITSATVTSTRYCLAFQKFYNSVTETRSPLICDGIYGNNTQAGLDSLLGYVKQGKKYKYCISFQKWFNEITDTSAPISEDGIYGNNTLVAYQKINVLCKG